MEVDGKKYRFNRTIGVDLEQFEWKPTKDKETDTRTEMVTTEGLQAQSAPIPAVEITSRDVIEAPPKDELVQSSLESIPAKESDTPKAPTENLPQINPIDGPVNPQHVQRSSELSSLRVQRKLGRDRDDKDESDGFRR